MLQLEEKIKKVVDKLGIQKEWKTYHPDYFQQKDIVQMLTALFKEQRREELIKFHAYLKKEGYGGVFESDIDEYLKSLKP